MTNKAAVPAILIFHSVLIVISVVIQLSEMFIILVIETTMVLKPVSIPFGAAVVTLVPIAKLVTEEDIKIYALYLPISNRKMVPLYFYLSIILRL